MTTAIAAAAARELIAAQPICPFDVRVDGIARLMNVEFVDHPSLNDYLPPIPTGIHADHK